VTPRVYVALTFDDGYIEQYRVAHFLSRLGMKATFFIISHLKEFEGCHLLNLKTELIRKINRMGHEIGSHTKNHPTLTAIPLSRVKEEVRDSKQWLEDLTGNEVKGFAYPYGAYNAGIVKIVSEYYQYGRGGGTNLLEDPFNVKLRNLYTLGGFARQRRHVRGLLQLPIKFIKHKCTTHMGIIILLHRENLFEILRLITYLKFLPRNTCFVTMSEFVESLRNNC